MLARQTADTKSETTQLINVARMSHKLISLGAAHPLNFQYGLMAYLQYRNVINMRRVCSNFYHGRFFYLDDKQHFFNRERKDNAVNYASVTTLPSLFPVRYLKEKNLTYILSSYMIADDGV